MISIEMGRKKFFNKTISQARILIGMSGPYQNIPW
jgi:hypothetical protein